MKKTIIFIFLVLGLMLQVHADYTGQDTNPALSLSLINQDPTIALAGDFVDVRLGMVNFGGADATNVKVEFVPTYPFQLLQGQDSVFNIGTMLGYQGTENMKIVKFRVGVDRNVTAGTFNLTVNYYRDGLAAPVQVLIPIQVNKQQIAEVIQIDKTILVPGTENNVTFRISNVGRAPINDLTFNWINPDKVILPVASDNSRYIPSLDVGQSIDVTYDVIADTSATAGLYTLDLSLTYLDPLNSSQTKLLSTVAGIYVGGGTDFDVAFSESSAGQTSFSIANIGSNPANSVSVIIPQQPGWMVSGSNSVIIGNLNKGDYTVASFNLQAMSSSNNRTGSQNRTGRNYSGSGYSNANPTANFTRSFGGNSLIVQIAYTDTTGARQTNLKEVNLSTKNIPNTKFGGRGGAAAQTPSFFVTYEWYIIGALVLVIGYMWYTRSGKKLNSISV
ncbi:NPCBM-associated, NEW3 domain of alpha-galactosidase [uncultured archaeon]|nr:NPCBM-associated, NEW3 domain of alpha-galactosidase [uncultured archaeon]